MNRSNEPNHPPPGFIPLSLPLVCPNCARPLAVLQPGPSNEPPAAYASCPCCALTVRLHGPNVAGLLGRPQPVRVYLDMLLGDPARPADGPFFEAFTFGETWNGWAVPFFDKAQADALVRAWNQRAPGDLAVFDEGRGEYVFCSAEFRDDLGALDATDRFASLERDGRTYYAIGGWAWTWNVLDAGDTTRTCDACGSYLVAMAPKGHDEPALWGSALTCPTPFPACTNGGRDL